jgi:hypothetical protein
LLTSITADADAIDDGSSSAPSPPPHAVNDAPSDAIATRVHAERTRCGTGELLLLDFKANFPTTGPIEISRAALSRSRVVP